MSGHVQVAIDGPAGSGKTTVGRALARRLGFLYLDTGAMYRALAFLALEARENAADEATLLELARRRPIRITFDAGARDGYRIFAGDAPLGDELYANDVSRIVSVVAAHPGVRELMVACQKEVAEAGPVVMAGRDIGTVVLPEAPVKIFLTASVEERVERRRAELAKRGNLVDAETLRREIEERDRIDSGRAVAPLRPAEGALEIDSSGLSVDAVVERIAGLVERA
jgi:cytidylate kinase